MISLPFLVVLVLVFVALPRLAAETSEGSQLLDAPPCQFDVSKFDRRLTTLDKEKTADDAISQMLREIDNCLAFWSKGGRSAVEEKNLSQTFGSGIEGIDLTSDNSTAATSESTVPATAIEESATDQQPASTPQIESAAPLPLTAAKDERSLLAKTVTGVVGFLRPNSKAQIEFEDQLGRNEIVLDEYAKTLYESYSQETDPVLKQELFETLQLYLDQES